MYINYARYILSKLIHSNPTNSKFLMRRKGFTLLEMVVVLLIVMALFLLTVPNIQKSLSLVHDKTCESQMKIIDAAILQYYLKHDQNPSTINELINEGFIIEKQSVCPNGKKINLVDGQASI